MDIPTVTITKEVPVTELPVARVTEDVGGHPLGAVGYYDAAKEVLWVGVRVDGGSIIWQDWSHGPEGLEFL